MIRQFTVAISILLLVTGCYPSITGTVVDTETGQPIEGAVVLVEWTKTHGFGEHWTESYRVVERLTGKDGRFSIPGVYSLFADPPHLVIYKKDYVAWSNEITFPGNEKRTDFSWSSGHVFKMARFADSYTRDEHETFVSHVARAGLAPENKQLFLRYYNEGEKKKVIEERDKKRSIRSLK